VTGFDGGRERPAVAARRQGAVLHRPRQPPDGRAHRLLGDGGFLINVNADESSAAPITVITNGNPEAKK
jgi:hypothetical protein